MAAIARRWSSVEFVVDREVVGQRFEGARLVALGAVRVRLLLADEYNESCLVMQDIEGNELCLD